VAPLAGRWPRRPWCRRSKPDGRSPAGAWASSA
jgi:hypothetical protein